MSSELDTELDTEMSVVYWNQHSDNLLNPALFEQELYNFIKAEGTNSKKTVIFFPKELTISDRHFIHTMSRTGVSSVSNGFGANRQLILNLSKNFIEHLWTKFYIPTPSLVPEYVVNIEQLLNHEVLNIISHFKNTYPKEFEFVAN